MLSPFSVLLPEDPKDLALKRVFDDAGVSWILLESFFDSVKELFDLIDGLRVCLLPSRALLCLQSLRLVLSADHLEVFAISEAKPLRLTIPLLYDHSLRVQVCILGLVRSELIKLVPELTGELLGASLEEGLVSLLRMAH